MNDEDFINIDDDVAQTPIMSTPQPGPSRPPPTGIRTSLRKRTTHTSYAELDDPSYVETGRTRYSSSLRNRPQPKLKLKLSEKLAAQAPGMSFLGPYDRELDSDDEDLVFEEQFILRMPPGEDCEKLRKMVAAREVSNDVWFKFKDSRRAVLHIGHNLYSAKLVDLPSIIESQKTLDNKQMFKVADICQMLVVEKPVPNEENVSSQKSFNIDDFIWPHGITPPLHHARKRRFRKRINKRTIETVEQEVERLMEADDLADQVKYDVLENVNPDLSDSEFIDRPDVFDAPTPGFGGSELGDMPTPGGDLGERDEDVDEGDEEGEEGDGDIDEDLAAELDLALGDDEEGEGDEEEEEEDESDDDDEDDDDDEAVQAKKLLNEEIRDLEAAVAKKNHEIASSANPLIRRRFEDALRKLQADLDTKLVQRDELKEKRRLEMEGGGEARGSGEHNEGSSDEDDDLFGEGPDDGMHIG
ncbi:TAFII55 protein conserved region-domain-containing protein [Irpex rosettiformis]|uniref:TAFII55 protein conserved region-domain-containing protein n=1 Tax=Irpex rosettiformis TaxID=378272 RepID=A0ACB8TVS0_9APHY|nr:TAFII55 protein conserved region-domain-containing protein [Irpex rosettiformis]